jgi:hypothetical protein
VNPFWIAGFALAMWAIILAFALGLRSEGFPKNDGQERAVITVSVVLTFLAITSAIVGGIAGWGHKTGFRHGAEISKKAE